MSVEEYEKHAEVCLIKPFNCPFGCTENISSIEEGLRHLDTCEEAIVKCNYCKTDVKRRLFG